MTRKDKQAGMPLRSDCYILPSQQHTLRRQCNEIWQLPMSSGKTAASARRRAATRGGFRPCWSFSDWARFWCTPTGPPCRTPTTPTGPTSHRSIRRRSSAIRRMPVRPEAVLVSELSAVLSGAAHSLDTRPVPLHLLLLSRRVLQVVLGRSAGVRRGRAAQDLSRRTQLSADHCRIFIATFCGSPISSGAFSPTTQ